MILLIYFGLVLLIALPMLIGNKRYISREMRNRRLGQNDRLNNLLRMARNK